MSSLAETSLTCIDSGEETDLTDRADDVRASFRIALQSLAWKSSSKRRIIRIYYILSNGTI
jgi:hypothetical protein